MYSQRFVQSVLNTLPLRARRVSVLSQPKDKPSGICDKKYSIAVFDEHDELKVLEDLTTSRHIASGDASPIAIHIALEAYSSYTEIPPSPGADINKLQTEANELRASLRQHEQDIAVGYGQ